MGSRCSRPWDVEGITDSQDVVRGAEMDSSPVGRRLWRREWEEGMGRRMWRGGCEGGSGKEAVEEGVTSNIMFQFVCFKVSCTP